MVSATPMDSNSIYMPAPPEGMNAFTYWAAVVESIVDTKAAPGYHNRLTGLFVMMTVVVVVSIVHVTITAIDYRRRGKGWWIYRLVKRPSGQFIVGNLHMLSPVLAITCVAIFYVYLTEQHRIFFAGGSLFGSAVYGMLPWIFVNAHSWILSWASLQAFMLTSKDGIPGFPALAANTLFIAPGLLMFILFVVITVLVSRASTVAFDLTQDLSRYLAANEATFTTTADITHDVAAHINDLWLAFLEKAKYLALLNKVFLYCYVVVPIVIACVNVGGICLIFIIRKQIKYNADNLKHETGTGLAVSFAHISTSEGTASVDPEKSVLPVVEKDLKHKDSRKSLSANSPYGQRLQLLKRAEADLIVVSVNIFMLSLAYSAASLWLIIITPTITNTNWPVYETALSVGSWLFAFIAGVSISANCWIAWKHLTPLSQAANRGSPYTEHSPAQMSQNLAGSAAASFSFAGKHGHMPGRPGLPRLDTFHSIPSARRIVRLDDSDDDDDFDEPVEGAGSNEVLKQAATEADVREARNPETSVRME